MSKSMGKDRGRKRHITSFYIETLVLVAVFLPMVLVLARVFALSGDLSGKAERLTQAVHLAENAAEAVAASESLDTLQALLEEDGNVRVSQEGAQGSLQAWYGNGMEPVSGGEFRVEVSWLPVAAARGSFVESTVRVYWMEEAEPLYVLETAVYLDGTEVH